MRPWNITKTFLVSLRFTLQLQWAALLNFSITWQLSLTFLWSTIPQHIQHSLLDWKFYHNQIFLGMFFITFFAVIIIFKNLFNKLICGIFTSIDKNQSAKLVVNTSKFIRKTTSNVMFIFFCERTALFFNFFKYTQNQKWS